MKILLLGEYSNVHWTLAEGLRRLGHHVTVVSNGDFWKNYPRDIDLSRSTGLLGTLHFFAKLTTTVPRLRGYDIVQLINPLFFELKAERLFPLYRYLRRNNGKVFLGAFGMDYYWVSECRKNRPLRYSDFNIGSTLRTNPEALTEVREWVGTEKERLNRYIAEDCDGIIAGLYEYWVCYRPNFPHKTTFIPFPIRLPLAPSPILEPKRKIRIFIGINKQRHAYKGTDVLLAAAERIVRRYPEEVELVKAESVPFVQYQHLMNGSDLILDQLYSYTPSMNPLLAMSKGIVCVGGGEPENYDILGEKELRPIINVLPCEADVYRKLEDIVRHPERLPLLKAQSIAYVKHHHDYLKVARQYLRFWQSKDREGNKEMY